MSLLQQTVNVTINNLGKAFSSKARWVIIRGLAFIRTFTVSTEILIA